MSFYEKEKEETSARTQEDQMVYYDFSRREKEGPVKKPVWSFGDPSFRGEK